MKELLAAAFLTFIVVIPNELFRLRNFPTEGSLD